MGEEHVNPWPAEKSNGNILKPQSKSSLTLWPNPN